LNTDDDVFNVLLSETKLVSCHIPLASNSHW
jgi:hypothetical protein